MPVETNQIVEKSRVVQSLPSPLPTGSGRGLFFALDVGAGNTEAAYADESGNVVQLTNTGILDVSSAPIGDLANVSNAAPGMNDVMTWTGSQWEPQAAGSGANTALSNLATTSINADLDPDGHLTRQLGVASTAWQRIDTGLVGFSRPAGGMGLMGFSAAYVDFAASVQSEDVLLVETTPDLKIIIGSAGSASATASGDVHMFSGFNSSTGNSGNVLLATGTVTSGTRGKISLRDGSEGTAGHVWTSTGTAGEGNWAAPSGGGGSIAVEDEGTPLTTAVTKFNFAGAGVTVTEPIADEMLVTIPGGSIPTNEFDFTLAAGATIATRIAGATGVPGGWTLAAADTAGIPEFGADPNTLTITHNETKIAAEITVFELTSSGPGITQGYSKIDLTAQGDQKSSVDKDKAGVIDLQTKTNSAKSLVVYVKFVG